MRTPHRRLASRLAASLLLAGARAGAAQQIPTATDFRSWTPPTTSEAPDTRASRIDAAPKDEITLAFGGVLGLAGGLIGGGMAGYGVERLTEGRSCYEECGLTGLVYGAIAGTSLGIPAAVHLADGRRGDLGRSVLVSTLLGAVGLVAATAMDDEKPVVLMPIVQIVAAIAVERRTAAAP